MFHVKHFKCKKQVLLIIIELNINLVLYEQ